MQHRFFALISRMRYIGRWGLMRNTFEENIWSTATWSPCWRTALP